MNQDQKEENTYNDTTAKKLVNSYRFKSQSPQRKKVWTPQINNEDVQKKKRQREDEYIKHFNPDDRPILLIKNKEEFQDITYDPETGDNYVKLTDNTQIVQNVRNQILSQSNFIRRDTKIHGVNKKQTSDDQLHFYKIEGIEFLPEGFLELDPLLYHDDYAFETQIHKELFSNEQRKIKAKRRKQYQQRKLNKMRDITLYIADEKQEMVLNFLDKWYFKKRRKMNNEEIQLASQEFQIDPQSMAKLQDHYLEHKKMINTKDLHDFLMTNQKIRNGEINLPPSLAKYFVKSKGPYANVKSKVYDEKKIYNPYKINEWENKVRYNKSKSKNKKGRFVDRIFKNTSSSPNSNKNSNQNLNLKNPNNNSQVQQKQGNQKLQNYFDTEVNKILDKINNHDGNINTQDQPPINNFNQQEIQEIDRGAIDELIGMVKSGDITPEPLPQNPAHNIKSKPSFKSKFPEQSKKNSQQNSIHSKPSVSNNQSKSSIKQSSFSKPTQKITDLLEEKSNKSFNKPKSKTQIKKKNDKNTKKRTQSDAKKQVPRSTQYQRVSLVYKNDQGDTVMIQKLGPILIGNDYYFQSIEEVIPKDGKNPEVHLITKNEQGAIVNKKPLEMDKLGKFYTNKVVFEPQTFKENNQYDVIVQSDKGQTISVQNFNEKLPFIINNDASQRQSVSAQKGYIQKDRSKTYHILQPINIGDQFYQQVVNEVVDGFNNKNLVIVTHDQDGNVISKDEITGNFGDKYSTEITQDILDQKGQRQVKLSTIDDQGNEIIQHDITIRKIEKLNPELVQNFQKGRITMLKNNGNKIRSYTMAPLVYRNTFYIQKLYEEVGSKGQQQTLVTINDKGEIVGKDKIVNDYLAENYATAIMEEQMNQGRTRLTLMSKNDKGQTINIKQVEPRFLSISGEKNYNEFQNRAKGKTTICHTTNQGGKTINKHTLRPTVFGDHFYQQTINEIIEGPYKKATLITKDENDKILSEIPIQNNLLLGEDYSFQIAEIENNPQQIKIITKNENGEIIASQDVEKTIDQYLDDHYVRLFDEQAKGQTVIQKNSKKDGNKLSVYTMRPTIILDNLYQQLIMDLTDNYGEKDRYLILKDQNGQIVDVTQIETQTNLDLDMKQQFAEDRKSKSVIVSLLNNQDEIVGYQNFPLKSSSRQSRMSILSLSKDPKKNQLRHTMVLKQKGLDHYQQIVEELLKEDGKKIKLTNLDQRGSSQTIIVDGRLKGDSYQSRVGGSFIDQQGKRKTTIEIINDKEQVLGSFLVDNKQLGEEQLFDGQKLNDLKKPSIVSKNTNQGIQTLKKIRSTQVGTKTYDCYFEEILSPDGSKRLTFIMKDENDIEVERKSLEPNLITKEYYGHISDKLDDLNNRSTRLEFRNGKRQVLMVKEFPQNELHPQQENFDLIEGVYNKQNQRIGSVFVKNQKNIQEKTYKLRPTQIGSQFYQHTINELIENGQPKRLTYVISNENGEIINTTEIPIDKAGENYYHEIKEDIILEGKDRKVTLQIKNDKDDIIQEEIIIAELNPDIYLDNIVSNILEEEINDLGEKRVSIYPDRKSNLVMKFDPIPEEQSQLEDEGMNPEDKIKLFEDLFNKYGENKDPKRLSVNQIKKNKQRPKAQTFNVKQQKYPKKNLLNNEQYHSFGQNEQSNFLDHQDNQQDQELKKRVSKLINAEKEKLIENLMQNVEGDNKIPFDFQEEFEIFVRDHLPTDEEYKDSVLMLSLYYYYTKKKNQKQ